GRPSSYSPEFREEAVQLALKSLQPIAHTAREFGMHPETLRTWVRQYERGAGAPGRAAGPGRTRQAQRTRTTKPRVGDGSQLPEKSRSVLREGSPVASKYEFIESMRLTRVLRRVLG
ncbi:transposase, partial [Streptodolium elevatio]